MFRMGNVLELGAQDEIDGDGRLVLENGLKTGELALEQTEWGESRLIHTESGARFKYSEEEGGYWLLDEGLIVNGKLIGPSGNEIEDFAGNNLTVEDGQLNAEAIEGDGESLSDEEVIYIVEGEIEAYYNSLEELAEAVDDKADVGEWDNDITQAASDLSGLDEVVEAIEADVDDKADDPHGNESHSDDFAIDGEEQPPQQHGNEAHEDEYVTDADIDGKAEDPHGNEAHSEEFAVDGDEQPPELHGNEAHEEDYITDADLPEDSYTDADAVEAVDEEVTESADTVSGMDSEVDNLRTDKAEAGEWDDDVEEYGTLSDLDSQVSTNESEIETLETEAVDIDYVEELDTEGAEGTAPVAQDDGTLAMEEVSDEDALQDGENFDGESTSEFTNLSNVETEEGSVTHTPTTETDIANKSYVDSEVEEVEGDGLQDGENFNGEGTSELTDLANVEAEEGSVTHTPTANTDIANKEYVDEEAGGLADGEDFDGEGVSEFTGLANVEAEEASVTSEPTLGDDVANKDYVDTQTDELDFDSDITLIRVESTQDLPTLGDLNEPHVAYVEEIDDYLGAFQE